MARQENGQLLGEGCAGHCPHLEGGEVDPGVRCEGKGGAAAEVVLAAAIVQKMRPGAAEGGIGEGIGARELDEGAVRCIDRIAGAAAADVARETEAAGLDIDQAGVGETWLSSQNRNFKNRMGKGNLAILQ